MVDVVVVDVEDVEVVVDVVDDAPTVVVVSEVGSTTVVDVVGGLPAAADSPAAACMSGTAGAQAVATKANTAIARLNEGLT